MQWHLHACTNTACMCVCAEFVLTAAPGFQQRLDADLKKAWVLLAGHGWVAGSVSVATQRWESSQRELVEWCKETERLLYSATRCSTVFRYVSCVSSEHQLLSLLYISLSCPLPASRSLSSAAFYLTHSALRGLVLRKRLKERESELLLVLSSLSEKDIKKNGGGGVCLFTAVLPWPGLHFPKAP